MKHQNTTMRFSTLGYVHYVSVSYTSTKCQVQHFCLCSILLRKQNIQVVIRFAINALGKIHKFISNQVPKNQLPNSSISRLYNKKVQCKIYL